MTSLGRLCPPAEELTRYIGPPLRWTMRQLLGSEDPELIEQGVNYYRERYGDGSLLDNVVYDGIPPLLETLRAEGYPLYVVTSKPTHFARMIVEHLGLAPYFIQIFGPEFDGQFDDKADLLAYVLKVLQADPARGIMIGDRFTDVLAGKRNGVRTIALTYGFAPPGELEATGPDRTCCTPAEIYPAVRSFVSA
jgi:phosphoglycolate phosphatase